MSPVVKLVTAELLSLLPGLRRASQRATGEGQGVPPWHEQLGAEGPGQDVVTKRCGGATGLPPFSARLACRCVPEEDPHPTVPVRNPSLPAWRRMARASAMAPTARARRGESSLVINPSNAQQIVAGRPCFRVACWAPTHSSQEARLVGRIGHSHRILASLVQWAIPARGYSETDRIAGQLASEQMPLAKSQIQHVSYSRFRTRPAIVGNAP
jgi:hypothetical protein